jgi:hypothetical protein
LRSYGDQPNVPAKRRRRAWLPPLLLALATLALLDGSAEAEHTQSGELIVSLNGGITPRKLPRDHLAPVAVRLQGGIRTAGALPLPRVKEVRLELAWRGALYTRGLAVCPRARLRNLDSRNAIATCGAALVGRGRLYARVFLPNQTPFGVHAHLLAFNGQTERGHPAVWVLAYSTHPPASFVLPFHVRHQPGNFRTVLVTVVPRSVGPWPHFASFHITVSRRFSYRGQIHSYISASCPVPRRFTAGFLSLARATFDFAEGQRLRTETVRSCRAR